MVSSDLPEVIGLSDRIGVLRRGRLAGILDNHKRNASPEAVMRLGREEGILASPSAGGALAGCLRVAQTLRDAERFDGPAVLVTIFPDSGVKYLSERFWQEAAHAEN